MKEIIEIRNGAARLKIFTKWIKECKYTDFKQFYKAWFEKNPTLENETIEEIKEALQYSKDKTKKLLLFENNENKKIDTELKKLINYIGKQKKVFYQTIDNDKCMISDSYIVIECLKSDIELSKNITFKNILDELYKENKTIALYDKSIDRCTCNDGKTLLNVYNSLSLQFENNSDNLIKTDFKDLISINKLEKAKKDQSYTTKENITMKRTFIDIFKNKEFIYNQKSHAVYKNCNNYNLYAIETRA